MPHSLPGLSAEAFGANWQSREDKERPSHAHQLEAESQGRSHFRSLRPHQPVREPGGHQPPLRTPGSSLWTEKGMAGPVRRLPPHCFLLKVNRKAQGAQIPSSRSLLPLESQRDYGSRKCCPIWKAPDTGSGYLGTHRLFMTPTLFIPTSHAGGLSILVVFSQTMG